MGTRGSFSIDVRFFHLPEELTPYFTALYLFEIDCPDGRRVEDCLHPEWAAMRFTTQGSPPFARIGSEELEPCPPFVVSGPTSHSLHFGLQKSLIWGLGLQPAGFAKFVDAPASNSANQIVAGIGSEFEPFAPIFDIAQKCGDDWELAADKVGAFLLSLDGKKNTHGAAILACQMGLRDPEISTVEKLADHVGFSHRSLERLCAKYFGFPPKLLLRRQRFLRSLAQFMLAPEGSWSEALDGQYYDQAHFVRDFKSFMGMTPSGYAEKDHPILDRIMAQRMADQGAAPTPTDLPTVLRYSSETRA